MGTLRLGACYKGFHGGNYSSGKEAKKANRPPAPRPVICNSNTVSNSMSEHNGSKVIPLIRVAVKELE